MDLISSDSEKESGTEDPNQPLYEDSEDDDAEAGNKTAAPLQPGKELTAASAKTIAPQAVEKLTVLGEDSEAEGSEAEGPAAGTETEEGSYMPTGKIIAEPTKTDATDESAVVAKGAVPDAATTQRQHNQAEGKREPTGKETEKKKTPFLKATSVVDPKSPEAPLGAGAETTPAVALTEIRTHCGYDWAIDEGVQYNRMGKSKDCVALEAVIVKFPKGLPTTDYYAKAYIRVLSTPDQQPICVNVRSLEKKEKTEKSQRPSTLKQEEPSAAIDVDAAVPAGGVDSDQDTVQVSHHHSSKKRKAESLNPSGTPRSPGGTSDVKWGEQSAEHIAQKASLPVPDAKTKEAFVILLQAMIEGLNGPTIAEIKTAKTKLERKYRKLLAAHTTATTELADAVAAGKAVRARVTQRETQLAVARTKVRTLEDQAKEREAVAAEAQDGAQELAKTKRQNDILKGQVKALSNRTQELQDRIQALERTDGAAQGSAEGEAAKNQELEKLTAALAEKDKEIKRLKAALLAFV